MKTRALIPAVAVLFPAFIILITSSSLARSQPPLIGVETVLIGDAAWGGNASDPYYLTTPLSKGVGTWGQVNSPIGTYYRIGKYEVTISQYAAFLNSVAKVTTAPHLVSLWNPRMADDLNVAGITRTGDGSATNPYTYAVIGPFGTRPEGADSPGDRPITYVSWYDAARFCNWLANGATNGADTETGTYTLNGATNGGPPTRNADATWWMPSFDEWYKAGFYKGGGTNAGYWDYATQSDTAPRNTIGGATNQANYFRWNGTNTIFSVTQVGDMDANQNYLTDKGAFSSSPSAYGTFDQQGSVREWCDNDRVAGVSWSGSTYFPPTWFGGLPGPVKQEGLTNETSDIGFRVARAASQIEIYRSYAQESRRVRLQLGQPYWAESDYYLYEGLAQFTELAEAGRYNEGIAIYYFYQSFALFYWYTQNGAYASAWSYFYSNQALGYFYWYWSLSNGAAAEWAYETNMWYAQHYYQMLTGMGYQ